MFPDDERPESTYYETCTKFIFKKYFVVVEEINK